MEINKVNQPDIDETKQLKSEMAPLEIFFGAAFISIILVIIAIILVFILVTAG